MYFVINKTKKHITFQDISITLGPRQCIDLQRVMKKEKYENSRHLRIAQGNGLFSAFNLILLSLLHSGHI